MRIHMEKYEPALSEVTGRQSLRVLLKHKDKEVKN